MVQHVEIGILRNSSSTLHYNNGSCTWKVSVGTVFQNVAEGPQSTITRETTRLLNGFSWRCIANGSLLLDATVTVHGEPISFCGAITKITIIVRR